QQKGKETAISSKLATSPSDEKQEEEEEEEEEEEGSYEYVSSVDEEEERKRKEEEEEAERKRKEEEEERKRKEEEERKRKEEEEEKKRKAEEERKRKEEEEERKRKEEEEERKRKEEEERKRKEEEEEKKRKAEEERKRKEEEEERKRKEEEERKKREEEKRKIMKKCDETVFKVLKFTKDGSKAQERIVRVSTQTKLLKWGKSESKMTGSLSCPSSSSPKPCFYSSPETYIQSLPAKKQKNFRSLVEKNPKMHFVHVIGAERELCLLYLQFFSFDGQATIDTIPYQDTVIVPTNCELTCHTINAGELDIRSNSSILNIHSDTPGINEDCSISIVVDSLIFRTSSHIYCDGDLHLTINDSLTGSGQAISSSNLYLYGRPDINATSISIAGNNMFAEIDSITSSYVNISVNQTMDSWIYSDMAIDTFEIQLFINSMVSFSNFSCNSMDISADDFVADITINQTGDIVPSASNIDISLADFSVAIHADQISVGTITGVGSVPFVPFGCNGITFDSILSIYDSVNLSNYSSISFVDSVTITPSSEIEIPYSTALFSITSSHLVELSDIRIIGLPSGQGPGCPITIGVGASHGGKGGKPPTIDSTSIKNTYGSPHTPACGSGAGSLGGMGGGYFVVSGDDIDQPIFVNDDDDLSTVILNGTISVAGVAGVCDGVICGGGGSGGGVLFDISCVTVGTSTSSTPSINLRGGDGGTATDSSQEGGGGGGGGYLSFSENVQHVDEFSIDIRGGTGSGQKKKKSDDASDGNSGIVNTGSLCADGLVMVDSTKCIDNDDKHKLDGMPAWAWMTIVIGIMLISLFFVLLILWIRKKYFSVIDDEHGNLSVSYLIKDKEKALNIDYSQYNIHGSEISFLSDSSLSNLTVSTTTTLG
ncbi:hypothetical protein ADUPG1_007966, partial [Aduncisulcus paluster]